MIDEINLMISQPEKKIIEEMKVVGQEIPKVLNTFLKIKYLIHC